MCEIANIHDNFIMGQILIQLVSPSQEIHPY